MNTDYARYRLEVWGDWARDRVGRGLGYPSMSVEQKAIFGRGGTPHEPDNPEAEQIDIIVRKFDSEKREIAVCFFVRGWSLRGIAKKLRCGKSTIGRRVEVIIEAVSREIVY